jgi:hypothetical protein
MKKKIHYFRANFKTPQFAQFLRQAKILILEILHVFLWLKFLSSLNLNKLKRFETGSFILAVLLITGCQHTPSQYLLFDYEDFGPQAMAWETIGMQWWQWDNHGDSDPNSIYDIKIVVYRDISLQEIQSIFPVVEAAKKDFRYIEYNEVIKYLNRNIDEVGLINKKWAKGLKIHLVNTRNRIKAFWVKN